MIYLFFILSIFSIFANANVVADYQSWGKVTEWVVRSDDNNDGGQIHRNGVFVDNVTRDQMRASGQLEMDAYVKFFQNPSAENFQMLNEMHKKMIVHLVFDQMYNPSPKLNFVEDRLLPRIIGIEPKWGVQLNMENAEVSKTINGVVNFLRPQVQTIDQSISDVIVLNALEYNDNGLKQFQKKYTEKLEQMLAKQPSVERMHALVCDVTRKFLEPRFYSDEKSPRKMVHESLLKLIDKLPSGNTLNNQPCIFQDARGQHVISIAEQLNKLKGSGEAEIDLNRKGTQSSASKIILESESDSIYCTSTEFWSSLSYVFNPLLNFKAPVVSYILLTGFPCQIRGHILKIAEDNYEFRYVLPKVHRSKFEQKTIQFKFEGLKDLGIELLKHQIVILQ